MISMVLSKHGRVISYGLLTTWENLGCFIKSSIRYFMGVYMTGFGTLPHSSSLHDTLIGGTGYTGTFFTNNLGYEVGYDDPLWATGDPRALVSRVLPLDRGSGEKRLRSEWQL